MTVSHARQAYPRARRNLVVGLLANLGLAAVKVSVGLVAKSQALVADGVHSVSDLVTDFIVWLGIRLGREEADEDHPYGHGKIETLASLGVGLALAATGSLLAYRAGHDLIEDRISQPGALALAAAGLSILVKEWLFFYTRRVGRAIDSQALIANAWHHRSDSLSSLAVLLGVGAAVIWPQAAFLDKVATMIVAGLIIKVAFDIGHEAVMEMIDTAPPAEEVARLVAPARRLPEVVDINCVKVRRSGGKYFMDCQVDVSGRLTLLDAHGLSDKVEQVIKTAEPKVAEVFIHLEPFCPALPADDQAEDPPRGPEPPA